MRSRRGSSASWGRHLTPELQPGPAVVAHPAAIVLALLTFADAESRRP